MNYLGDLTISLPWIFTLRSFYPSHSLAQVVSGVYTRCVSALCFDQSVFFWVKLGV